MTDLGADVPIQPRNCADSALGLRLHVVGLNLHGGAQTGCAAPFPRSRWKGAGRVAQTRRTLPFVGRSQPRAALAVATAATVIALAGCGDSAEPEPQSPDEVVSAWVLAYAEGDGEGACGLMTDAAQSQMLNPYAEIRPQQDQPPDPPVADTCQEAVVKLAASEPTDEPTDPGLDDSNVGIAGDRAVVAPDGGFCFFLERVEGDWLISSLPLPADDDPVAGSTPCPAAGDL